MAVNPEPLLLGCGHAIVAGRARRYEVSRFTGPLSLKSVVSGTAVWTTERGRFEVNSGEVLAVGDGEEYSLEIDALHPVETFCLFFDRQFARQAWTAAVSSDRDLLDGIEAGPLPPFEPRQGREVAAMMAAARRLLGDGAAIEPLLVSLASAICERSARLSGRVAKIPAARKSTRQELHRRVGLATEHIHANLDRPLSLAGIGRAACLSPFHLHRLFRTVHGETPHRYATRLRLARAAALLRSSDEGVTSIAWRCGFESVSSFTTLFGREHGAPPAQFRKNREDTGPAEH
jgi:AraC-like DNA-binding protein